jgi:hypothetical protein
MLPSSDLFTVDCFPFFRLLRMFFIDRENNVCFMVTFEEKIGTVVGITVKYNNRNTSTILTQIITQIISIVNGCHI